MDNLDVTDTYYDKKISDLQRRLDAQYDRIDEVEETRAELTKATYDEIKKPIGILQGKSLPRILRQNKYVTKRKNS